MPGWQAALSKDLEAMSLPSSLDKILRRATEDGEVPGVVAAIGDRDALLYEGAFGVRSLADAAPMRTDTVAWIASMTKPLVSAAALLLVERGRLDLDSALADSVPALGAARVLTGFDAAGQPLTRESVRPVTLRHLLTHTSGFAYEYWSEPVQRVRKAQSIPGIASCQNKALSTPLLFDPGERWQYGISTDWLGKVVEAASGLTLGRYLRDHLLGPLGMQDTAFRISPSMQARLAAVHRRDRDGTLQPSQIQVPQDPDFEMGGGGLYGTAGDYLRFVRMILNGGLAGGQRVLAAHSVAAMTRNQIGALPVTPLRTVLPTLSNDVEFFPGVPKGFSFGFQVNLLPTPTGLPAGGLMWAGLANTYFWIDPTTGIGGVFMSQVLPFADTKALPLFLRVQQAVYEALA
jgi:CubicO group peptidase (beta-lactamase class C family)